VEGSSSWVCGLSNPQSHGRSCSIFIENINNARSCTYCKKYGKIFLPCNHCGCCIMMLVWKDRQGYPQKQLVTQKFTFYVDGSIIL
jgi:hypothetical protein